MRLDTHTRMYWKCDEAEQRNKSHFEREDSVVKKTRRDDLQEEELETHTFKVNPS